MADVTSDQANDDREGHDWSAEGGATAEGPATAVPEQSMAQRGTTRREVD